MKTNHFIAVGPDLVEPDAAQMAATLTNCPDQALATAVSDLYSMVDDIAKGSISLFVTRNGCPSTWPVEFQVSFLERFRCLAEINRSKEQEGTNDCIPG
jgi:hypothetical protein